MRRAIKIISTTTRKANAVKIFQNLNSSLRPTPKRSRKSAAQVEPHPDRDRGSYWQIRQSDRYGNKIFDDRSNYPLLGRLA